MTSSRKIWRLLHISVHTISRVGGDTSHGSHRPVEPLLACKVCFTCPSRGYFRRSKRFLCLRVKLPIFTVFIFTCSISNFECRCKLHALRPLAGMTRRGWSWQGLETDSGRKERCLMFAVFRRMLKRVNVARTRLPSVGFRSAQFLAVSLQM